MYHLAFMILHDKEESGDIVHDVFVRLLDDDIRFDSDMAGALSCVRNGCLNVMRALAPVSVKCVTFRFIDLKILKNNEHSHDEIKMDCRIGTNAGLVIDGCTGLTGHASIVLSKLVAGIVWSP